MNFCAKIERYSWISYPKKYQKIEFSYQNSRFWPKIELTKTLEKVNFGAKIRNSSIFWNFNFKIFCQNCVQKVKFTTMQLFSKVEFLQKKCRFETVCFSVIFLTHSVKTHSIFYGLKYPLKPSQVNKFGIVASHILKLLIASSRLRKNEIGNCKTASE